MTIFEVRPEAGLQRAPEGDGWVAASHAVVQTLRTQVREEQTGQSVVVAPCSTVR